MADWTLVLILLVWCGFFYIWCSFFYIVYREVKCIWKYIKGKR